jgi:hypothetical protein
MWIAVPSVPNVSRPVPGIAATIRAGFAAMLVLVSMPAVHAAETTPAGMLKGIYREAVKGTTSAWLEPQRRGKYLSKSLLALWAKTDAKMTPEGYAGPIDFDLTTDTNGLELQGFEIKAVRESPDTAVVAVKLGYRKPYYRPGPPAVVTYGFIREEGRWRIDNFHTPKWSVREILTQSLEDS